MFYKFIIKIRHALTKVFFLANTFKAIIYAISCEFDLLMFCIFLSDEFFKKSMVKILSSKSLTYRMKFLTSKFICVEDEPLKDLRKGTLAGHCI